MFFYLYEIKNNLNGKIYIGVHKTKSLNDSYMGSGQIIKSAIIKHGLQNFTKTILEYFENSNEMFLRESEIVNLEFLNRDDVYNIHLGGCGGFEYINKNHLNRQYGKRPDSFCKKMSERNKVQVENGTHIWQGEIAAALSKERQLKRIKEGIHTFCDSVKQRERCMKQIENGTHAFLGGELQRKRVAAGTHHFCGERGSELSRRNNELQLKNGTHPSQIKCVCEYCGKTVSLPNYKRWHSDNCKYKPEFQAEIHREDNEELF